MDWDWQTPAALVLVIGAAICIACRGWRAVRRPQGAGCSGCDPPKHSGIKAKPLIQIETPADRQEADA